MATFPLKLRSTYTSSFEDLTPPITMFPRTPNGLGGPDSQATCSEHPHAAPFDRSATPSSAKLRSLRRSQLMPVIVVTRNTAAPAMGSLSKGLPSSPEETQLNPFKRQATSVKAYAAHDYLDRLVAGNGGSGSGAYADQEANRIQVQPHRLSNQPQLAAIDNMEELTQVEDRIRESIAYTRSRLAEGERPQACSYFNIPVTQPPSTVLLLLRDATDKGIATLVFASLIKECYSIGVPAAVQPLNSIDAQWWLRLSRAQMRAGPLRTSADIKSAEYEVKKELERRRKSETQRNGKLKTELDIMGEGLRRQQLGLPMSGQLDQDIVQRAMDKRGHELTPEALQQYSASESVLVNRHDAEMSSSPSAAEVGEDEADVRPSSQRSGSRHYPTWARNSCRRARGVDSESDGDWMPGHD